MSDITLESLQSQYVDLDKGLHELQKAMQTTTNADVVMPIDYDPQLKKRIVQQTPFLEFLRGQGCVTSTDKIKVGYKLKRNNNKTNFMAFLRLLIILVLNWVIKVLMLAKGIRL